MPPVSTISAAPTAGTPLAGTAEAGENTSTAEPAFYQDVEPASCTLGYNCTAGGIPIYRGICVQAKNPGAGRACWDVCNPNHLAPSYNVSEVFNPVLVASTTGMIQAVRANLNPIVQCPNMLGGDPCKPGDFCSKEWHDSFNIPEGRGMCVLDESQPNDRACWDMCDSGRRQEDYTMGTASGTGSKVGEVRGNGACPGIHWWQVLLYVLLVLLILACLVAVAYVVKFGLNQRKRTASIDQKQRHFEAEPRDFKEDFPDMDGPMMEAGLDGGPYGDDPYHRDMQPPPSPPRQHENREVLLDESYGESYGPPPNQEPPRGYYGEQPVAAAPPEVPLMDQQHPQQQQHYMPEQSVQEPTQFEAPFYPGPTAGPSPSAIGGAAPGIRIPGLDEPNLLGNLGHMMQQQQADAFHTQVPQSPALIPSSTQSGGAGQTSFNFAPGQQALLSQSVMPSFHTQLPPMYQQTAASPPGSVQLRPPGSQQWFTQLQRR